MRILLVSQYFWPEAFRVNDLAAGLAERGHEVTVLTGQPNYETGSFAAGYSAFSPRHETIGEVTVYRFPLVARGTGTGLRLALSYASFAISSSVLAPVRLHGPFDVALVYQMSPVTMAAPALVLKVTRRLPVVLWVQDLWPDSLRATGRVTARPILAALRRLVNAMFRRCDRVLVQSEAFVSRVVAAGVPENRVSYVPNWAERFYEPRDVAADAPERAEVPPGFRVMLAGNLGVAQSLGTVVDAAEALTDLGDIRWIIIGDGRQRLWMQQRVAARGLESQFRFIDRKPVESMPQYFALADVLLATLAKDPSFALTVPSRLQSYLACGRPIVAALDGEGARVVRDAGAGLACDAEDAAALARAIRQMHGTSTAVREQMGASGRRYYEDHFGRDLLIDRVVGSLMEVADAPSLPHRHDTPR